MGKLFAARAGWLEELKQLKAQEDSFSEKDKYRSTILLWVVCSSH